MQSEANERGYLNEHFRLFHTTDLQPLQVDWHFHTFDKLVFFRSGQVEYSVESETYALRPGDLLLISHGQLHRMRSKGGAAQSGSAGRRTERLFPSGSAEWPQPAALG